MDTDRLYDLLNDLEDDIDAGSLDAVNELIQALTAAKAAPTQDHASLITTAASALNSRLTTSPINSLPPSKLRMLDKIGASNLFGQPASARIDAYLTSMGGPASSLTGVQAFLTELLQFKERAISMLTNLKELQALRGVQKDYEIGIVIPTSLVDGHLGPLQDELEHWNGILRTYAEIAGDENREVTVRALVTGSYELYVAAGLLVAQMMARTIERVTETYKRVLEIRVLRQQLEEKGAPRAETAMVREHEKSLVDKAIADLVKDVFKMGPRLEAGRKQELTTQLTFSIRHIARFVDEGGDVEVSPPRVQDLPAEEATTATEADVAAMTLIAKQGAAIASLPPREQPILQITEGSSKGQ